MEKEWMRKHLPETPPKGYEKWIAFEAADDLAFNLMLYSAERVKVYPELKETMCPEDFEPIKTIWRTRCSCTVCGEDFVTKHIPGGFQVYSGPDGCLYEIDPESNEVPDDDAVEDLGYDTGFIEITNGDGLDCPTVSA